MLTRSQVARRLGRSLATVRRLEGKELHPEQDARGVHRFDPDEVGALADRLMETGSLSAALGSDDGGSEPWVQDSNRVDELLADNDRLRRELGDTQHRARMATCELDRFKSHAALVLTELASALIELEPDMGDVVLAAMRELDA